MAAVRGSWLVSQGIVKRWRDRNLDQTFRDEWGDDTNAYKALHDEEARPSPPGPYCVYDVAEPVVKNHQTGHTTSEEIQTQEVGIQFRIHAKSTGSESGKSICIRLAKAVRAAFDNPARFVALPDTHVETINEPDFHTREGDEEWVLAVPYTLTVDAAYNV